MPQKKLRMLILESLGLSLATVLTLGVVIFIATTEDALQKIFSVLGLFRSGLLVLFRKERLK